MKSFRFLLVLLVSIAMTITLFPSMSSQESVLGRFDATYQRGKGSSPRHNMYTCDKYPRVCSAKSSPGPDCCRKTCVNVMTDRFNCGRCGKKCRYSEMCCEGWCVNTYFNKRHCGKCNNACKKGSSCSYGMCNYA
ncbi:PREDICTED: stigma-specific STIG1-like protein 1 [Nicotiana attenuata]|uniref:Stigma-specific stig1-like protein 1 n=1 Tax=Nicotiana attenuata TaxID=49451 RepID=A0A1J6IET6_NICAT|nr:PREDICTED: stigma-specific STIG1-like protein 1 [Nicotiana attenuata]OIS99015.1 stigma-specific stig1-like protein 1 [Nicotiana attenuata]